MQIYLLPKEELAGRITTPEKYTLVVGSTNIIIIIILSCAWHALVLY